MIDLPVSLLLAFVLLTVLVAVSQRFESLRQLVEKAKQLAADEIWAELTRWMSPAKEELRAKLLMNFQLWKAQRQEQYLQDTYNLGRDYARDIYDLERDLTVQLYELEAH